jgi:ribosomal protein S18 acetylase RimI-like enzyme
MIRPLRGGRYQSDLNQVIESPLQNGAARARFRDMTPADIAAGLKLSRAAGWNQTERDWGLFLQLSPKGCRVAVIDERVVGTVATARYEDRFAWIGMVLVDPPERGQGIGARLTAEALEVLEDMPSIRLDATPAGHAVYQKLGFVDEYRLSRMERLASSEGLSLRRNPARPMMKDDLPAVAIFDRQVFGADRRLTLEWMFDGAPEYAWIIEERGQILGYMLGRRGYNFESMGPVVAHDQRTARRMVSACLNRQAGKPFIIDASHHDADWRAWLDSASGGRSFECFIVTPLIPACRLNNSAFWDRSSVNTGSQREMPIIETEAQLEDALASPNAADVDFMRRLSGDVAILGAGGKMGPSLAARIRRATDAAGAKRRVIAVSRFSAPQLRAGLEGAGVETIPCDLLDRRQIEDLPDCENVFFLAGRKFGSTERADLT